MFHYVGIMEIAEIKRVIQEQGIERETLLKKEKIIEREINKKKILSKLAFPNILAILGVRRCGKSVFTWLLLKGEKCGYINFDDEALYGIESEDLNNVLKVFYQIHGSN